MPPSVAEMPHPGDSALSTPSDHELLGFLRRKLAGEPLPAAAGAHFHDSDIYVAEPDMLTLAYKPAPAMKGEGASWWFFTQVRPKSSSDGRKSRVVVGNLGTWHSERAPRPVLDGEGNCVGHSQYFSYKRKIVKNRSQRTDWYMVEYSDGHEGDHGRVHGGEPKLVLCKIYRAHSGSRSSSSSRSACKRKATDEHADQSSAPVKAKRRLFASPAPTLADASQEQVRSRVPMSTPRLESQSKAANFEPEAYHGKIGGTLDGLMFLPQPEALQRLIDSSSDYLKFWTELEASENKTSTTHPNLLISQPDAFSNASDYIGFLPEPSQGKIDSTSDYLQFLLETQELQNKISTTPPSLQMSKREESQSKMGDASDYPRFRPEPSQGNIDGTIDCLKFSPETKELQNKTGTTPPSLLMSEPDASQRKIGGTPDFLRFWPEPSQGKTNGTSDYLRISPETEELQSKTSTTSPSLLTFESEVRVPQDETTTKFNCGIQMAGGGAPPVPAHYYQMTEVLMDDRCSSVFSIWGQDGWSSACNDSTAAPCSRSQGCFVGAPSMYNEWSTAGFRMPSASLLLPSVSPSSWCSGPALWSC